MTHVDSQCRNTNHRGVICTSRVGWIGEQWKSGPSSLEASHVEKATRVLDDGCKKRWNEDDDGLLSTTNRRPSRNQSLAGKTGRKAEGTPEDER